MTLDDALTLPIINISWELWLCGEGEKNCCPWNDRNLGQSHAGPSTTQEWGLGRPDRGHSSRDWARICSHRSSSLVKITGLTPRAQLWPGTRGWHERGCSTGVSPWDVSVCTLPQSRRRVGWRSPSLALACPSGSLPSYFLLPALLSHLTHAPLPHCLSSRYLCLCFLQWRNTLGHPPSFIYQPLLSSYNAPLSSPPAHLLILLSKAVRRLGGRLCSGPPFQLLVVI